MKLLVTLLVLASFMSFVFLSTARAQTPQVSPTMTPGTEPTSGAIIRKSVTPTPSPTPFGQPSPTPRRSGVNSPATEGRAPASVPGDYHDSDPDTGFESGIDTMYP